MMPWDWSTNPDKEGAANERIGWQLPWDRSFVFAIDAATGIPKVTRPGRMNALEQFGHASQPFQQNLHRSRCQLALPGLDDCRGTDR